MLSDTWIGDLLALRPPPLAPEPLLVESLALPLLLLSPPVEPLAPAPPVELVLWSRAPLRPSRSALPHPGSGSNRQFLPI
jgi:hypothetical protein